MFLPTNIRESDVIWQCVVVDCSTLNKNSLPTNMRESDLVWRFVVVDVSTVNKLSNQLTWENQIFSFPVGGGSGSTVKKTRKDK